MVGYNKRESSNPFAESNAVFIVYDGSVEGVGVAVRVVSLVGLQAGNPVNAMTSKTDAAIGQI